MTRIDPAALAERLAGNPLARRIVVLEETPSTNLAAKALAAQDAPSGTLVLANRQTAGCGRRGRAWQSEAGAAVCMSLLLRPEFPAECAPRITIAAALGVCRALRTFGADAAIKWPNDVYAGGKKLSGILSELGMQGGERPFIVCGIGINVGQRAFSGELAETATSLLLETGHTVALERVISEVVCALAPLFPACGEDAAYAVLMEEYRRLSCTLGRQVKITGVDGVRCGRAEGLDALGRLLLRTADGTLLTIQAGDVSLRNAEKSEEREKE